MNRGRCMMLVRESIKYWLLFCFVYFLRTKKMILSWNRLFLNGKQKKGQTNKSIKICGKGTLKKEFYVTLNWFTWVNEF